MKNRKQQLSAAAVFTAAVLGASVLSGCGIFESEKIAGTVSNILETAYVSGGATLVGQRIDKLATDGRITQEQADLLKAAARKSYADLQKRLKELSVADIEVSAEK